MRENELLHHVYAANRDLPGRVVIPPGDDMAGLDVGEGLLLVAVDQLADGVHFQLPLTPLDLVARKALTRNLSDVAAMAAEPVASVAAITLPRGFDQELAHKLFDAMHELGAHYGCPLVGGDVGAWDQSMILTVTILARPNGIEPVLRSGAKPGEALWVSGRLGGAMEEVDGGRPHHLTFEPRVALARRLAGDASTRPSAMIDLSDGLGQDLPRLCQASGVRATVEASALPLSEAARQASARTDRPAWHHALSDGEDHELLLAAPAGAIPAEVDGVPLTRIGTIEPASSEGPGAVVFTEKGGWQSLEDMGWEHRG